MKTLKKMLCIILSVITVMCLLPLCASADAEDYLDFAPVGSYGSSNFHYEVVGCIETAPSSVVIPSSYEGFPVTKIRKEAFKRCGTLEELTIPATVTDIFASAFDTCLNLKKVTFKGQNVAFKTGVFRDCTRLAEVTLPSKLTEIQDYTFYGCASLQEIDIPSTVKYIGINAFASCTGLKSIVIPASTTAIGTEAFAGCSSVEKFTVDPANTAYKSVDGVLFSKNGAELINYPAANSRTSYNVPDGTKRLLTTSFAKCSALENVTLPDSLEVIEQYAFSEAASLKSINLNKVKTIGSMAFAKCTSLESVTIPATVTDFDSAFVASGIKSVVFENGVKTISSAAFDSCKSLSSVTIPDSVTKIEQGAFKDCASLSQILIPATVTTIEKNAFVGIANNITLIVNLQSAALKYAQLYSIDYVLVDGGDIAVTIGDGSKEMELAYYKTAALAANASGLKVKWSSSDPKVVKVDENGNIKAVGKGSAVITAAVEGAESISSSVKVTVTFTFWQKIIYFFRQLFGITG